MVGRTMNDSKARKAVSAFLWGVVSVGVVASLFACVRRYAIEASNRNVAIVLDCEELLRLSALSGVRFDALLRSLKRAGASAVAISEMRISDAIANGDLFILPKAYLGKHLKSDRGFAIASNDYAFLRAFQNALEAKTGKEARVFVWEGMFLIVVDESLLHAGYEGFGLNPKLASAVKSAGLNVIARLSNTQSLTNSWLNYALKQSLSYGARVLLFDGEEVLGYRERIRDVAGAMRRLGLTAGIIEFAKQRGEQELANALDGAVIRAHSVAKQELAMRSPEEIISRFVRAVRERNVRICYLRIPTYAFDSPSEGAEKLVSKLKQAIRRYGFEVGIPQHFEQPLASRKMRNLVRIASSLATASALSLFLLTILRVSVSISVVVFLLVAISSSAMIALNDVLGALACSLLTALTFPTLAICTAVQGIYHAHEEGEEGKSFASCAFSATASFAICSAITFIGAMLIVGFLCERRFMVGAMQFRGVKLSQLLPMLIFALLLISGWMELGGSSCAEVRERFKCSVRRLCDIFSSPVLWWHAVATLFILAFCAYWVIRTGNIAPEAVPTWELKLRELLERFLVARPRFKEAFLGHPALLIGLWLMAMKERRFSLPLVLVGFIGQLSMFNTFTHIHTPLQISLLRTAHGLWIGWLIGIVALSLISFILTRIKARWETA
jgi:hypothetical protein